jgi:hypothetical protein
MALSVVELCKCERVSALRGCVCVCVSRCVPDRVCVCWVGVVSIVRLAKADLDTFRCTLPKHVTLNYG